MFAFPKKLPPRHKKRKKKKIGSPGDVSSDDEVMKEKSGSNGKNVTSSMGFGKDIKGEMQIKAAFLRCYVILLLATSYKHPFIQLINRISSAIQLRRHL